MVNCVVLFCIVKWFFLKLGRVVMFICLVRIMVLVWFVLRVYLIFVLFNVWVNVVKDVCNLFMWS